MVAQFPTVTVEVAFATAPLAAVPTWTNITSFVEWKEGAKVTRGRTYETEQIQPGTLSLTLNNADGRFTPGNTASPYYPNVKSNRRIRVRATWNSITYALFDGYIDSWPVAWDNGVWAKAQVAATDRLKLLARRELRSMLEEETLATLDPYAYFPLTESSEATTASDISVNKHRQAIKRVVGSGAGDVAFGSGPAVVDDVPSARFSRTTTANGRVLYSRFPSQAVTGWSVSGWFAFPHTSQTLWNLRELGGGIGVIDASLFYIDVGNENFEGAIGPLPRSKDRTLRFIMDPQPIGGVTDTATFPGIANDTTMHHVVCTAQFVSGTSWETRIYVDGFLAGGPNTVQPSTGAWDTIDELWIGGSSTAVSEAAVGHVALFDYALNATQVQLLMDGSLYYPDDLAGARIQRLLSYDGIVSVNADVGKVTLGRQVTTGQKIDSACAQVAATEGGVFFIGADGTPTFHDREHRSASINLAPNPSFEVNTTSWESPDGTVSRVTTQRQSGIASAQLQITDLVGTPVFRTGSPFITTGVLPSRWYVMSAWDRLSTAGTRSVGVKPLFLRSDNSITLNPTTVFTSSTQGVWTQRLSLQLAPADTAKIQAGIFYNTADAALNDIHQIDTVEVYLAMFVLDADQLTDDLRFEVDESLIRNEVTISRANGRQIEVSDATSIDDYGQLDYSEEALITSDRDASDRANYILARYAQPSPRAAQIGVDLVNKTTTEQAVLNPALLAADIGQRFAVRSLPSPAPASIVPLDVDGLEHSFTPDNWVVKLDASPPPQMFIPRATFKLDDTVLGKLDSGNFLGA